MGCMALVMWGQSDGGGVSMWGVRILPAHTVSTASIILYTRQPCFCTLDSHPCAHYTAILLHTLPRQHTGQSSFHTLGNHSSAHTAPPTYLRPGDLGISPHTEAALGDKVVNAASAVLVASVPILHRAVLDLRVGVCVQLHNRRMQLWRAPCRKTHTWLRSTRHVSTET